MSRLLLLLACIWTAGCATSGPPGEREGSCPIVEVQNQNYNDVIVYHIPSQRRLGRVRGFTTRALRPNCALQATAAHFRVRAFGNAFSLTLRGASSYLERGDRVGISVGAHPRQSFIIGL